MVGMQKTLTDKTLFEYYLVSSVRQEQIISRCPCYIARNIFNDMVGYTLVLDNLVRRIILRVLDQSFSTSFQYGSFPLIDDVLDSGVPLYPFFWTRYDAFQREGGGVFFSEFNYDKPCAQREALLSGMFQLLNDPNANFVSKFREGFKSLWELYGVEKGSPRVAILVDPEHYEEVHLAFLYIDLLKPLGYEFIITGGDNLTVEGGVVFAFGGEVDIILRQYPTEFLFEVENINEILELFSQGKVLLINDPRAVIGQTKSLFAFLWDMVKNKDPFLTGEEIQVIKAAIPFTEIYVPTMNARLAAHKDGYVIKAAYGRYSEEVYIGRMCTEEEWSDVLEYVTGSSKLHIVQEFCPIKRERVMRFDGDVYKEEDAFGNFGIHLANGEFSGICVRWSTDYLSLDSVVWSAAVGIRDESLKVDTLVGSERQSIWNEINDEAAFRWGYTDSYTGAVESFLLQGLTLERKAFDELQAATEQASEIIKKTTRFVQENSGVFCPVLGISDALGDLVAQQFTDYLTFIGRLDWVYDANGCLKLLEFNSETPGGALESIVLSKLIKDKVGFNAQNPNDLTGDLIASVFNGIVNDYSKVKGIRNIAELKHEKIVSTRQSCKLPIIANVSWFS